jgi:hypothetical protein
VDSDENLFLKIIEKLDTGNVLQQIVLIGSWVLPIYRTYFDDDPEIPILRTTDVDFLLEMPPNIQVTFDIPLALSELGFEPANLGVTAQPLRFLSLAYDHSMRVLYHGYNVRVPEPDVFVLLKLLILPRRNDEAKRRKDASTARAFGEFLLKRNDRKQHMQRLFRELPKGW